MTRFVSCVTVCLLTVLSGCVSTHVKGRSLTASPKAYRSVAVFCDVEDENVREEVERAVAEELTRDEVRAIASLDLLNEPKVYGPAEVRSTLAAGGWEAMLVIGLDEYVTEVFGRPGRISTGITPYGGTIFIEPPVEYDRSTLRFHLEVMDRDRDDPVWVGDGLAHSSQVHSLEGLSSEIAAKARGLLEKHGILHQRKRGGRP